MLPTLRCRPEVTFNQTVPEGSNLWSDQCALETPCALEVRSKLSLIRPCQTKKLSRRLCDRGPDLTQTIVQMIVRLRWPLIRLFPDQKCHWTDNSLNIFQTTSRALSRRLCHHAADQTQTIVQTIERLRWPLIRLSPDQLCNWSDQFLHFFAYCIFENLEIWSGGVVKSEPN